MSDDDKPPDPWQEFFQKAKQLGGAIKEAGPEGVVDVAFDGVDKVVTGAVSVSHLVARMGKRALERTIQTLEKGGEKTEEALKALDGDKWGVNDE